MTDTKYPEWFCKWRDEQNAKLYEIEQHDVWAYDWGANATYDKLKDEMNHYRQWSDKQSEAIKLAKDRIHSDICGSKCVHECEALTKVQSILGGKK